MAGIANTLGSNALGSFTGAGALPLGSNIVGTQMTGQNLGQNIGMSAGLGSAIFGAGMGANALSGAAPAAAGAAAPTSVEGLLAAQKAAALPQAASSFGNAQNILGLANMGGNLAGSAASLLQAPQAQPVSLPGGSDSLMQLLMSLQQQAMQGSVTPQL